MKKYIYLGMIVLAALSSCENQDWEFPDYNYSTVYFAYQSPVRTIVLGKDYTFDNTLDNEYKCQIMATIGGVYENKNEVIIDVEIDNSLCNNLIFGTDSSNTVLAMPANYYSLPDNMQIIIPSGELMGGIEVQLTDAFFDDTLSVRTKYVIPLVMNSVANADSILQGDAVSDNADRRISGDWNIAPKDYVLYAVKYMNPWHANYLRRGIDVVNGSSSIVYHEKYVEQDQVCSTVTRSRYEVSLPLEALNEDQTKTPFELILAFNQNNNCTIRNPVSASYTISGSGSYIKSGDMWGGESRDALYLQYEVDFGTTTHAFTDTLVLRDRGVKFETFSPTVIYE